VLQSFEVTLRSGASRLTRFARRAAAVGLLGFVLALTASPGEGFAARNFPRDARFGKLTAFTYPYASIGGKALRMSPGAKIYNEQNLIIMPAAMRQQAKVLYRLDNAGSLSAIWLLTEHEAAAFERRFPPVKPAPDTGAASATVPAGSAQ
jgi:hypothetical protein